MLDLKMLIPEEISGTRIESEISQDQIHISGRYRNHRGFSLNLNRFIDEPLFYFGCGLFAGEGTKGGKGTPFEFANSNPMIIWKIIQLLQQLGIPKSMIFPESSIKSQQEEFSRLDRDAVRLLVRTHGDTQGPVQKGFDTGQGDDWSK